MVQTYPEVSWRDRLVWAPLHVPVDDDMGGNDHGGNKNHANTVALWWPAIRFDSILEFDQYHRHVQDSSYRLDLCVLLLMDRIQIKTPVNCIEYLGQPLKNVKLMEEVEFQSNYFGETSGYVLKRMSCQPSFFVNEFPSWPRPRVQEIYKDFHRAMDLTIPLLGECFHRAMGPTMPLLGHFESKSQVKWMEWEDQSTGTSTAPSTITNGSIISATTTPHQTPRSTPMVSSLLDPTPEPLCLPTTYKGWPESISFPLGSVPWREAHPRLVMEGWRRYIDTDDGQCRYHFQAQGPSLTLAQMQLLAKERYGWTPDLPPFPPASATRRRHKKNTEKEPVIKMVARKKAIVVKKSKKLTAALAARERVSKDVGGSTDKEMIDLDLPDNRPIWRRILVDVEPEENQAPWAKNPIPRTKMHALVIETGGFQYIGKQYILPSDPSIKFGDISAILQHYARLGEDNYFINKGADEGKQENFVRLVNYVFCPGSESEHRRTRQLNRSEIEACLLEMFHFEFDENDSCWHDTLGRSRGGNLKASYKSLPQLLRDLRGIENLEGITQRRKRKPVAPETVERFRKKERLVMAFRLSIASDTVINAFPVNLPRSRNGLPYTGPMMQVEAQPSTNDNTLKVLNDQDRW